MEKDTLVQLIQNANTLSANDAETLEEIAVSYPYCQNTYFLLAKYAQKTQDDLLVKKIRKAATYAYNRHALRTLIEGKEFFSDAAEDSIFEIPSEESNLRQTRVLETDNNDTEQVSQKSFEIAENEINESRAMELVQEGKDTKAIEIYKILIARFPEKDSYYRSQISVLSGEEFTEIIEPAQSNEEELSTSTEENNLLDNTINPSENTTIEDEKEDNSYGEESFFEAIEESDIPSLNEEKEDEKEDNSYGEESFFEAIEENDIPILNEEKEDEKSFRETELEDKKDEISSETDSFFENLDIDKEVEIVMPPQEREILSETKSDISPIDDNIEDEKEAVFLFNQGKIKEAVSIYEKLTEKFPEKKDYYKSQIQVLTGYEDSLSENIGDNKFSETVTDLEEKDIITTDKIEEKEVENVSFFDNLEEEIEKSTSTSIIDEDALSEGQALDLFNEGRTEEAVKIYSLLIEKNPDKADYYRNQIDILKN